VVARVEEEKLEFAGDVAGQFFPREPFDLLAQHRSRRLVHGTPVVNTQYWTEDRPDSFALQMAQQAGIKQGDAIAFGHTHQLWHHAIEGMHFVNCGTAGRPKDGDPRVSYALLRVGETGEITTEFVRVAYDVERAARGIRESGLPNEFAEFLETGGKVAWAGTG